MKKTGKLMSMLLVMAMVITAFPMIVLADYGLGELWDYTIDSEGTLTIDWTAQFCSNTIVLKSIQEDLSQIKSVVFDLTGVGHGAGSVISPGIDCSGFDNLSSLSFVDGGNVSYSKIYLGGIKAPEKNVTFEEGTEIDYLLVREMNVSELPWLEDCKVLALDLGANIDGDLVIDSPYLYLFKIYNCKGGAKTDLSKSNIKDVSIEGSNDISKIILPESCERLFVGYCNKLETIYIPESVKGLEKNTFANCNSLETIFYGGTAEQWEKACSGIEIPEGALVVCEAEPGWYEIMNEGWAYNTDDYSFAECWTKINGYWYYFTPDTLMNNDWQIIDGTWYYFGTNGIMKTGWQLVDGKWYYLGGNGAMRTGWVPDGGKWYYCDNNGAMVTGWKQINDVWYFFKSNGEMAANEYCNGYWLCASGAWTYQYVAKWTQDAKGWWYGDTSGWYAKNESYTINGKVYNFDASGYCTNP